MPKTMQKKPVKKTVKKTVKYNRKKKSKLKIRKQALIPLFVLIALVIYIIFTVSNFFFSADRNQIKICDFSKSETLTAMNNQYNEVTTISDYMFYGESLNLYTSQYDPANTDEITGDKVQLRNLCDDQTYEFIMNKEIDQQIQTADLTPGFYDIFIIDENELKSRAVYSEILGENSFTAIARAGKVKNLTLFSDPKILNNDDQVFDKNYLFLEVEEKNASKDTIDVYIDPYGKNKETADGAIDEGQVYHNVGEAQETYKAAVKLKAALEEYGLRAEISKSRSDEETIIYAEDSRLKTAYEKQAKYYIKLGLNGSPYDYAKGMEIFYSGHASSTSANAVIDALTQNTSLTTSTMLKDTTIPGILASKLVSGSDGATIYDQSILLRESGGKATLAATYNEVSAMNSFAKNNVHGMNGLEIDFLYISNKEEVTYWQEHMDEIINETAKALATMWNASKE